MQQLHNLEDDTWCYKQRLTFRFRNFSVSKLLPIFWRFRFRYRKIWFRKKSLGFGFEKIWSRKKVSVSVSENLVSEKKSRFRFRKTLVSEKSLGFGFGKFGIVKKSLGIGFGQNFGIVIQCPWAPGSWPLELHIEIAFANFHVKFVRNVGDVSIKNLS